MQPRQYQLEVVEQCWQILKQKGYVYLAGKPRAGKTLPALLLAEKSTIATRWLILTTINAKPGWLLFLNDSEIKPMLKHSYHLTNYEQLGRVRKNKKGKIIGYTLKLDPKRFDGIILDESHKIGGTGKPSQISVLVKLFSKELPHIHLSGTAHVETNNSIYYQMAISKYTPFKHTNFYKFFEEYGIPYTIEVKHREIKQYDRSKPELLAKVREFTVYLTQEDAGISKDLQAIDKLHYIELDANTKELYNLITERKVAIYNGLEIVCDTTLKERMTLHMIECGIVKIDDEYIPLGNIERINYIKKHFGDSEDVGIMSHFIGERMLLQKHFKHAKIYSSNASAEGVDLSHLKHYIISSSDYSGSKHIQRRERIVNIEGSNTLTVNFLLVKNAISEQAYKKTSKKEDFNNKTYERVSL